MATGRLIRKSIFNDDKVKELDFFAKLLYTWCIVQANREGRIDGNPYTIKFAVAKHWLCDAEDIETTLKQIAHVGLIVIYEDDNGRYIQFNNFKRLQKLENDAGYTHAYKREAKSEYPDPASCRIIAGELYRPGVEPDVEHAVEQDNEQSRVSEFMLGVEDKSHSPEAYKPMDGNQVITACFNWIKAEKDILLPAGSLEWDNVKPRDRGIAKNIGKITTPLWLQRALRYVKDHGGFIDGPFSPLVLHLIKKYNDTDRKALEQI